MEALKLEWTRSLTSAWAGAVWWPALFWSPLLMYNPQSTLSPAPSREHRLLHL
jgi:hypothetical protein